MRSHRNVLRQIAEQNLNPKVAYVKGKNGELVPKKPIPSSTVLKTEDLQTQVEESTVENTVEDPLPEVLEVVEEKSKKKIPPKKKKAESVTDE